jgi:hypothetical protein
MGVAVEWGMRGDGERGVVGPWPERVFRTDSSSDFLEPDLWRSEYFQAYPSTDRDLGSIAMDHRALRHHSFTSSPGKEQSAIQQ